MVECEALEKLDHPLGLLRTHAGERLVEDQKLRARGDQHGDLELALFAVAQMRGAGVGPRRQPGGIEREGHGGFLLGRVGARAKPPRARMARLRRDLRVLPGGERQHDVGALIAAPEPAARDGVGRPPGNVFAVEPDAPGARLERTRQQIDERRLAGAVRPDDAVHPVGREVQRDAVDSDEPAEHAGEILDLEFLAALGPA